MPLSTVKSATLSGIDALDVRVEVDVHRGLPGETIVGLPDAVVKESKSRIKSAIKNSGFEYPLRAFVINLAPAERRKEGPFLDLPIAVGILQATQQLPEDDQSIFVGELSLNGDIKPIRGICSICDYAQHHQCRVFVPEANFAATAIFETADIVPISSLAELKEFYTQKPIPRTRSMLPAKPKRQGLDFKEVKGQFSAKKALKIAAAGHHNLLLVGPPGSGKTMLVKRLTGILPPLTGAEVVAISKIQTLTGISDGVYPTRPFRAPHHTISYAGMVGGGKNPRPGEISLAHHGVLFLDELPEFNRQVIEALRQPLEDRDITLTRANFSVCFPAYFLLVAAMNPCPCGYWGDPLKSCTCHPHHREKYVQKISGPILDRMDMIVEVPRLKSDHLLGKLDPTQVIDTATLRSEVQSCQKIQSQRQGTTPNGQLSTAKQTQHCQLSEDSAQLIRQLADKGMVTGRSYDKIVKVSRTIADLDQSDSIKPQHVAESIAYRNYFFKT